MSMEIDDFLELVACISDIRHPSILELVGYCAEYGQRLLVYNHFSTKTLHDVLHEREDLDSALSRTPISRLLLVQQKP